MEIKYKRPSHQDLKKKALENPEVKKEGLFKTLLSKT